MVIGAQKSGTTYLCAALTRHRDVFHSDPKELLFFQRKDIDDDAFAQYLENFAKAQEQRWVGEGSAVYLQWPLALENARRYLGDELKIFICLRQPTDRAVSFYLHNLRKGRFDGSERIDQVGADVRLSPVLTSYYGEHIHRWLDVYGDNVHFLLFDDLVESPESFVRQATDFLDIAPLKVVRENAVNRGYTLAWDGESLTVDGVLPDTVQRPRFSRAQLEDLQAQFLVDIDRTAALIGQSLNHWKQLPEFTAKQANF